MKRVFGKAYVILPAVLLASAIFLSSCAGSLSVDLSSVEKVTVSSGLGEYVEIFDEEIIEEITEKLTSFCFSNGRKNDIDGCSYSVMWWNRGGERQEAITILGRTEIVYGGFIYELSSGEVDIPYFEDLFREG